MHRHGAAQTNTGWHMPDQTGAVQGRYLWPSELLVQIITRNDTCSWAWIGSISGYCKGNVRAWVHRGDQGLTAIVQTFSSLLLQSGRVAEGFHCSVGIFSTIVAKEQHLLNAGSRALARDYLPPSAAEWARLARFKRPPNKLLQYRGQNYRELFIYRSLTTEALQRAPPQ